MSSSFGATFPPGAALAATALNAAINGTVDASVTATGTVQGDAYLLVANVTIVTTCSAGTGVRCPVFTSAQKGFYGEVLNCGVAVLKVYPATGGTINGGGTNSPLLVPPGSVARIFVNAPSQVFIR